MEYFNIAYIPNITLMGDNKVIQVAMFGSWMLPFLSEQCIGDGKIMLI